MHMDHVRRQRECEVEIREALELIRHAWISFYCAGHVGMGVTYYYAAVVRFR
jgi:hypothetical protein